MTLSFFAYGASSSGKSGDPPVRGSLTIGFTGDVMLGRRVNEAIAKTN